MGCCACSVVVSHRHSDLESARAGPGLLFNNYIWTRSIWAIITSFTTSGSMISGFSSSVDVGTVVLVLRNISLCAGLVWCPLVVVLRMWRSAGCGS